MSMIFGTNYHDELYGSNNGDSIFGYGGDDTLNGMGGKDTLVGGKDEDYLIGGAGKDTFVYTLGDGDDTIGDYEENDNIKLTSSVTPKFSTKGNNVIITVGTGLNKGTVTILNAVTNGKVNKTITYIDVNGDEHTYNGDNDNITVTDGTIYVDAGFKGGTIKLSDYGANKINASDCSNNLNIIGNAKKNTLRGGSGNDTLAGGKGNDTLIGGDGSDIFVHSKGKDVITDYVAGEDIIKLQDTAITSWKINNNDVIFTTSTGSITVKDGKDKAISILETKTYSSSSALFAEDNLSDIVAEKSVGEFENYKSDFKQENLITFAE